MKRVLVPGLVIACVLGSAAVGLRAQVKTPDGFPAPGATPIVTLQSPGAEPRRPLRYAVTKGLHEKMTMDMIMGMSMDMAGMTMPAMQMPTMRTTADVAVSDVSVAGEVTFTLAFTEMKFIGAADADPNMMAALQASGINVTSISSSGTMTNRGVMRNVKYDLSKVTNPQMQQMMGSMSGAMQSFSQPLPEEPVGVGAKWDVKQAVPANGLQTFQTMHIEVVSMDADSCTLKTTLEQMAPPQPVVNAAIPAGTEASLDKLEGHGTSTTTVRFASLVPTSEANIQSTVTMSVAVGGDAQHIGVTTSIKSTVAPVK